MTLNRRDTILIAVLMNVGLLTILFITSINFYGESAPVNDWVEQSQPAPLPLPEEPIVVVSSEGPRDELDQMLMDFKQEAAFKPEEPALPPSPTEPMTEVLVKKGDTLEKIAKANKTTISALKKMNHLTSDKLKIGQKLLVPKAGQQEEISAPIADASGAVYYEVQSGDSPWKIAKKFNLRYDDILKLNRMDEAKARNLKVGDKIRIK